VKLHFAIALGVTNVGLGVTYALTAIEWYEEKEEEEEEYKRRKRKRKWKRMNQRKRTRSSPTNEDLEVLLFLSFSFSFLLFDQHLSFLSSYFPSYRIRALVRAKPLNNLKHVIRYRWFLIVASLILGPSYILVHVLFAYTSDPTVSLYIVLVIHAMEVFVCLSILCTPSCSIRHPIICDLTSSSPLLLFSSSV